MKMPFRKHKKQQTEPGTSDLDVQLDIVIHQKKQADERFEQTNRVLKAYIKQIGEPHRA